jgi:hypothetical protein
MKKIFSILLGSFVVVVACSDSTPTPVQPANDSGTQNADATVLADSSVRDSETAVDASDAGKRDAGGSLSDGGSCAQPADCGGSKVCCGTIKTGAGTPPNCPLDSLTTQCVDRCITKLSGGCGQETIVALCAVKSDCAGTSNSECCTFRPGGGQPYSACVPTFAMGLAEKCEP